MYQSWTGGGGSGFPIMLQSQIFLKKNYVPKFDGEGGMGKPVVRIHLISPSFNANHTTLISFFVGINAFSLT